MRLLQWNVQWCRGMDGRVDPERIARCARELADPDLCCFQEVAAGFETLPGGAAEDQVEALARAMPGYSAHYAVAVDHPGGAGGRRRFGNLLLSRLPVRQVLRHSLPWPAAQATPSMPRVALEAVVETPLGALRVLTTHLEYYSAAQRAAQVERLIELEAEARAHAAASPPERTDEGPFRHLPRPSAAVLAGDFNFRPGDPEHRRLCTTYADAWAIARPGEPHPPTFRLHDPTRAEAPYCCDFVFVTPELAPRVRAVRVEAACRASDHQPVIVEFG